VRNNPANLTDPTGLSSGCEVGCVGTNDPDPCQGEPTGQCGSPNYPGYGDGPDLTNFPEPINNDPFIGSLGCESLGMPCGMQFPSGGGGLSGCTYGSGNCGGMIYGYHDEGGYTVGDFPGESMCTTTPGGSCTFLIWSAAEGMWSPDPRTPCFGGDATCSPGQAPRAVPNIQSADTANLAMAGAAQGIAEGIAAATEGLDAKIALHEAHHTFWGERMRHIQITIWRAGVKGSGRNIRIPWPW
jgi:hypothetical protein